MNRHILFSIVAIVLSIFIIAFGMTTYRYYQAIHSDDPIRPYLSVELGQATISRGDKAIDMVSPETYDIEEGDIILTRADSQALVMWPDHSTTRLSSLSRLHITRMRVATDYSSIELVASLESGKSWSNIVRTLYPGSRIEFEIPRLGTVAGVRGTVFEINLDNNYIQSIDHSVRLSDRSGKSVLLMPGEAVLASDISSRVGVIVDRAWGALNQLKDQSYQTLRDTRLRDTYTRLAGDSGMMHIWDQFVRWILGFFSEFSSLDIVSSMSQGKLSDMTVSSQAVLLKWYQVFQSREFLPERDLLRGALIEGQTLLKDSDQIMDILMRGSLWDMQNYTGTLLKNTNTLLQKYAENSGQTIEELISGVKKINTTELKNLSSDIYKKLLK